MKSLGCQDYFEKKLSKWGDGAFLFGLCFQETSKIVLLQTVKTEDPDEMQHL